MNYRRRSYQKMSLFKSAVLTIKDLLCIPFFRKYVQFQCPFFCYWWRRCLGLSVHQVVVDRWRQHPQTRDASFPPQWAGATAIMEQLQKGQGWNQAVAWPNNARPRERRQRGCDMRGRASRLPLRRRAEVGQSATRSPHSVVKQSPQRPSLYSRVQHHARLHC